ncbi:MAG: TrmH family RNA methyltransferase [Candidatus Dojkabacteria bacterium]
MLVYGRNTVTEALLSTYKCSKLYLDENIKEDEKIFNILELARLKGVEIIKTNGKHISILAHSVETQNIALEVDYRASTLREALTLNPDKSFVYISESTFEQNVGAIIRTAECAGFAGVILPNHLNITPTIAKTSTGAIFSIPVIKYPIFQAIKELKKEAFDIIGIERGGENLYESKLSNNCLFIIGGEDKSLSDPVKKECNIIAEIPQFGKINSLNMSVATAIVIFEHIRQTKFDR